MNKGETAPSTGVTVVGPTGDGSCRKRHSGKVRDSVDLGRDGVSGRTGAIGTTERERLEVSISSKDRVGGL